MIIFNNTKSYISLCFCIYACVFQDNTKTCRQICIRLSRSTDLVAIWKRLDSEHQLTMGNGPWDQKFDFPNVPFDLEQPNLAQWPIYGRCKLPCPPTRLWRMLSHLSNVRTLRSSLVVNAWNYNKNNNQSVLQYRGYPTTYMQKVQIKTYQAE